MTFWISNQEKALMKSIEEKQQRYLMGIDPIPEKEGNGSMPNNKKWAWILVEGERIMAWVDNVTMKAYEADGYNQTDKEIPEYVFERWCTPHDL